MGRKKGQQQRVKGNVLPSSSVRSADLLARESINAGLGLSQNLPSMALGSLPELAGLDAITNTEFRTVLKKLYKRDVTTKLKALSEFCSLCGSAKQHDVLEMLPYWPRLFNRLFEDNERRVRENAQKAMHSLVAAAGKNLALQLKNLMGCWFVSQRDSYAPAAMCAEAGISDAFTGDKKISAYVFCREDILSFISSYIFSPRAKKDKSTEDEGNNFHRMVAACLEALSLYIRTVVCHKHVDGEIETILDNSSFWKFQKHTSPSIRAGYYSVLESLCIVSPTMANAHSTELCRSILHRLDENNVLVCKSLYAAAVAATAKCDSWHEKIDIHKGVLAGLRKSLKMGCYGLGAYVLPTLLPIFGSLPFDSDTLNVFTKLFEMLRQCIAHDSTLQSKRSMELAIGSYMEIVKLSVKRLSDNSTDMEVLSSFCDTLINDELLVMIKSSWLLESSKFMAQCVLDIIPSIIQKWEMHATDSTVVYNVLMKTFWVELSTLVCRECFDPENPDATIHIGSFLHLVCHKSKERKVKNFHAKRSVQFEDDADIDPNLAAADDCDGNEDYVTQKHTLSHVNKLVLDCKLLFPLKTTKNMLIPQKTLYEKLGNETLFSDLSNSSDTTVGGASIDNIKIFLNSILLPQVYTIIENFSADCEVLETLSAILVNVIRNCQVQTEFPCDISLFVSKDNPTFMTLFLQVVSKLLSTADYKTGPWLYSLINNNSSFNTLEVCKSLSICAVATASSSPTCILEKGDCWQLLENLLTVSYRDESGADVYICQNDLRRDIINSISTSVNELVDCPTSFEVGMVRFANIMTALFNSGLQDLMEDNMKMSELLWQKLMTDLFELYFVADDLVSTLHHFNTLFSLAAQGKRPFQHMEFDEYLRLRGLWISQKITRRNRLETFSKFIENTKAMVSEILTSLGDSNAILIFLEALLPSSQEWDIVRKYDVRVVKIDCMDCTILFPSRIESSDDVIEVFATVLEEVKPFIDEICKDFAWRNCNGYQRLVQESVVYCAISKHESSVFDSAPCDVKKYVLADIVQKSLAFGGLWAYSLRMLVAVADDGIVDVIFEQFVSSFQRSEVSAALCQTMLLLRENISNQKLIELLHAIHEKLKTHESNEALLSDVYSLAFGLHAACRLEREQESEILSSFHSLLLKWKSANICGFLDDDGDVFKVELVLLKNAVGKFYSRMIQRFPDSLCEDDWDFVQCALLAWIESIAKFSWDNSEDLPSVLQLANGSFKLLKVVIKFMASSTAIDDPTIPSSLTSEWNGFFSNAINTSLVKIFIDIKSTAISLPLLHELCECLRHVNIDSIFASVSDLKPKLTANSTLPDDVQTIVNHLCSSFITNVDLLDDKQHCIVIMMSYDLLIKILDRLSAQETDYAPDEIWNIMRKISVAVDGSFDAEEIEAPKSSAVLSDDSDFDDVNDVDYQETTVSTTLADTIESNIVSVLLYLLLWRILIKLTKFINPEKKSGYVNNIMNQNSPNITEDLLPHLFKIMVGKKTHFRVTPDLLAEESLDFEFIQHISACVYKEFLLEMPAASRTWFNDLPKVIRSRVDKFTASNVSPVLIENEFKAIRATASQQNKDGMEISAKPGAREVHASYQLNELKMEIAVCLPPNHPLGPITVNTEKRAGVVVGQWRYWILQITSFLQYQNGGIIDGLLMWKEKVDKKFEGMEECMICFSLVHGSSQSLPKLKCKTCKKKYHAQCLYKWFDTSNNSTCPLCRSPMIFR